MLRPLLKNCLMTLSDKILLRKRSVIETVSDQLKILIKSDYFK